MSSSAFVPPEFEVPRRLSHELFRLEPLGPQHNAADHAAWTSSIDHIRATAGFGGGTWPPVEGMSLERNLEDLRRHADDFARRSGFTYTVKDPGGTVVGCVYIYPAKRDAAIAHVSSWVTAERADLDEPLHRAVDDWLSADWPFSTVEYR